MTFKPVLEVFGLNRSYRQGSDDIQVLVDFNVQVSAGERVAITGASGSGTVSYTHLRAHET